MKPDLHILSVTTIVALTLIGCVSTSKPEPQALTAGSTGLTFGCAPQNPKVPEARYIGPYLGVENNIDAYQMAQDMYCADKFYQQFKNGFVTIYGSSRIIEQSKVECGTANDEKSKVCESLKKANDKIYKDVKAFAFQWNQLHGTDYPIMTGAGPGLMEAGSKGAMEAVKENAKLRSIGYTTYYDKPESGNCGDKPFRTEPGKEYCGDAAKAFKKYKNEDVILTDGLIFSSVVMREAAMIKHSAAIVITPGGSGTEWEIFQILETIKSTQLNKVPVFIVGEQIHWKSFFDREDDMVRRGTIKKGELPYKYIENPSDLLKSLAKALFPANKNVLSPAVSPTERANYRVATWNIEWLNESEGNPTVRNDCIEYKRQHGGKPPRGKCDKPVRIQADYDKLAEYANKLNADLIAVQEVKSVEALKKIFPPQHYDYWLSNYKQDQKTGLVVRKEAFQIVSGNDFQALGVSGGRVRYGADVTVKNKEGKELRLLSVHLKSGCFDKILTDATKTNAGEAPCPILREQLPILESWVNDRTTEATSFIVLGDFNRRLLWEARNNKAAGYTDGTDLWFWPELTDAIDKDLSNANSRDDRPEACGYGTFDEYIDHILLSKNLAEKVKDFQQHIYENQDFMKFSLSDHCPISIGFNL